MKRPIINNRSSLNVGGNPLPVREDLAAALHTAMYKGDRYAMRDYYSHVEKLASKNRNYKPLNKDDLAYALDLDVKQRGSTALHDYYAHEQKLASYGIDVSGKWGHDKNGSNKKGYNKRFKKRTH